MIKIIKPGYLKEAQCLKCGAVLSYDENEDGVSPQPWKLIGNL